MINVRAIYGMLMIFLLSTTAFSAQDCADLKACAETVSKLTGKQYIFAESLNKKMTVTSNFKLTEANADILFPSILSTVDLARIPMEPGTYKIIAAKELRYHQLRVVRINLDSKEIPEGLNLEDYYTFEYYFKHGNHGQPVFAVEGIRLMLSKYGRVFTIGKSLLVHDKASKFVMAMKVAQGADRELAPEDVKRLVDHLKETAKYYDKKIKN